MSILYLLFCDCFCEYLFLIHICLFLLNWITVILLVLYMHRSPTGNSVPLDLEIEATLQRNRAGGEGNFCKTEQLQPFLRRRLISPTYYHLIHHHQENLPLNYLKPLPWQKRMTRGLPLRIIQVVQYHNFLPALHVLKYKLTTSTIHIP